MVDELKNELVVRCTCDHGFITFTEDREYDNEIYIQFYETLFDSHQYGIFDIIKNRIKFAWFVLRGKDFHLFDIVLTGDDRDNFKKNLTEFVQKLK